MIPPKGGIFFATYGMGLYRYINALSLDVVAGAIICTLFFANLFEAELPPAMLITLGLAVWSIYTLDHLWDAFRSKAPTATFRHHFHLQHQLHFKVLLLCAIVAGLVLFWYIPKSTKILGTFLTLMILVYFLSMKLWPSKSLYHKELFIAIVYSLGILLGPYSLKQIDFTLPYVLISFQFTTLALINLLIISYVETEADQQQSFGSLSRSIGKQGTRWLIITIIVILVFTTLACGIVWFDHAEISKTQVVFALMTVPATIILISPVYFKQMDRYRFLVDATFFIPLLVL